MPVWSRRNKLSPRRNARSNGAFRKSSLNAPIVRCNLAVVYAWTGQPELAIAELNGLVDKPAGANLPAQPTYGDLKLNPVWDPLRSHPGFAGLMQKFASLRRKKRTLCAACLLIYNTWHARILRLSEIARSGLVSYECESDTQTRH